MVSARQPERKHKKCHVVCRFINSWDHLTRASEPLWGSVPKLYTNLEEILSRAHGNFEEQNIIIIINYCIIIYANYNYIVINV